MSFQDHLQNTTPKMKFSIKEFFSKCDQIRSFLQKLVSFFVEWNIEVRLSTLNELKRNMQELLLSKNEESTERNQFIQENEEHMTMLDDI